jgi:EAL domain-containing protein (putative c-di-GMP-specific phosphodiesterase class I)
LPVSINITTYSLQRKEFCEVLQKLFDRYPSINPAGIELEIVETQSFRDLKHLEQVINDCHAIGVNIALDDFGTGYSSLDYLRKFSINTLKIDRSFVSDMCEDIDDMNIVKAINSLAIAFQCKVIAEGVETHQQGIMLQDIGCECAQGYIISKPLPAREIPAWLDKYANPVAWQKTHFAKQSD